MSGTDSLETKLALKLVVDTKAYKVLFAEGGKIFIDFVIGILALPVGALIKLIKEKEQDVLGSLGDLHDSIDELSDTYTVAKRLLLQKDVVVKCHRSSEDFVKEPTNCMVRDDLRVQPMSAAHILDVMSNVEDVKEVKEITVQVGVDEASKLLKAALNSKNVLTDVFLKGACDPGNAYKPDVKLEV